jgi:hypothetical protein
MPPTVASSTVDAGIFVVHASHFFDQFGDDRRVVRAGVLVSTAPPVDRQHLPQEPAFRVQVTSIGDSRSRLTSSASSRRRLRLKSWEWCAGSLVCSCPAGRLKVKLGWRTRILILRGRTNVTVGSGPWAGSVKIRGQTVGTTVGPARRGLHVPHETDTTGWIPSVPRGLWYAPARPNSSGRHPLPCNYRSLSPAGAEERRERRTGAPRLAVDEHPAVPTLRPLRGARGAPNP